MLPFAEYLIVEIESVSNIISFFVPISLLVMVMEVAVSLTVNLPLAEVLAANMVLSPQDSWLGSRRVVVLSLSCLLLYMIY